MGTVDKGARSDSVDKDRLTGGLTPAARGGEELSICVDEVGTGVGYVRVSSKTSRVRFSGRGKAGDEDRGSNAGSKEEIDLFISGTGRAASSGVLEGGVMVYIEYQMDSAVAGWGSPPQQKASQSCLTGRRSMKKTTRMRHKIKLTCTIKTGREVRGMEVGGAKIGR